MRHLGDITKINGAEIEPVDCITFGSPCQDLSVAGKRAGLAGERSGLFMEAVRIIKEMRKKTNGLYPTFAVWENVPGAFSSNGGADFGAVLEEMCRICAEEAPTVPVPDGGWPKAGCLFDELGRWSVAYRLVDAQYWGTPQRRKRIALVADLGGIRAPQILFEQQGLPGNPQQSGEKGQGAAGTTADRIGTAGGEQGNPTVPCTMKIRGGAREEEKDL